MIQIKNITTTTTPSAEYELIDSGNNRKLERFGNIIVSRPDPQALWPTSQPRTVWSAADASYEQVGEAGRWVHTKKIPDSWSIKIEGMELRIKPTTFKHVGIFPEHADNWHYIQDCVKRAGRPVSVINLFGYTGAATVAAAQAGATVCHVDGSKTSVTWARQNAEISKLGEAPIRWIVDDVRTFLKREIKRGHTYDAIVMDPPAFGRGAEGEVWKIERDFVELLELCKQVLSTKPLFVMLNGYAAGYSAIAYKNNLEAMMKSFGEAELEYGEMTIQEKESKRLLPCGIFARWRSI